ncbi:MAG: DNA-processing protein DprA [Chthonomonas sp.]|nr:DNA-processing protein DprA [Chthonomonas sp.]
MDADLAAVEAALAWLYLPGMAAHRAPAPRHRWLAVVSSLRAHLPPSVWPQALRHDNLWEEALLLDSLPPVPAAPPFGGAWALTGASPVFPARWLQYLAHRCPPAFWAQGPALAAAAQCVSVVGSRQLGPADIDLATSVGWALARAGYVVASGGALGADTAAVLGVGAQRGSTAQAIEVLPHGLALGVTTWSGSVPRPGVLRLSASAPTARFTAPSAIERNTLLYTLGLATVVVRCQHDTGGTWSGATSALRRRLGPVFVFHDDANFARCGADMRAAAAALVARGATPVRDIDTLLAGLSALAAQPYHGLGPQRQASLFA